MTAAASALPGHWYTAPEVLAAEQEQVLRRSWHYAGHTGDLATPAGWFPGRAGPVPVLVTRDAGGTLRALEAVCRHQGAVINPPARAGSVVHCAYHGWTYGLDGTVLAAAPADRRPGFDRAAHSLPELPVAVWGPLVFIAAHPDAARLADALGPLPERLAAAGIDPAGLAFARRDRERLDGNWKQWVEEHLDGTGDRALLYPATTVELDADRARLSVGHLAPAGASATERLVDHFRLPAGATGRLAAGAPGARDFRRRLREALGAR